LADYVIAPPAVHRGDPLEGFVEGEGAVKTRIV
jgi:hypothetical protein